MISKFLMLDHCSLRWKQTASETLVLLFVIMIGSSEFNIVFYV